MVLSDFFLQGTRLDLQHVTLLNMLDRDRPKDPNYIDEPQMTQLVAEAMSEATTKSYRYKILALAIWNYNGRLSSPLDPLLQRLFTEDQSLAIDLLLDVWLRAPIEIVPRLIPYLATTHHPERLRQMIGATAHDLKEEIDVLLSDEGWPLATTSKERRQDRRMLNAHFSTLGAALQRLQPLRHKTDEIPDFAAGIVLQLRRARDKGIISERECERLQAPFLVSIIQPGRPDLIELAHRRLGTSSPR